jgi:hypothetical protein
MISRDLSRASAEEARIRQEIVDAAVLHYSVFSAAFTANQTTEAAFRDSTRVVQQLQQALGSLQQKSQDLSNFGGSWRKEKQLAANALIQHQKLLELLEAPQTMEVCVRGEMYHEALLVMEHVFAIAETERHLPLVRRIEMEMQASLRKMLESVVLPRLASSISLALALKIVTFLRRLKCNEQVLRSLFLQRRAEFIESLLRDAESTSQSAYSFLSKYMAIYKVHVTEVASQFYSCFAGPSLGSPCGEGDQCNRRMCDELTLYCQRRAAHLIRTFETRLQVVTNGAELSSLVEQCSSCGLVASKVGIDVSAILIGLSTERIRHLFASQIASAALSFRAAMSSFSWRAPSSTYSGRNPADVHGGPPVSLLQFLPLAYALNGFLTACNEVRKCAATSIAMDCSSEVIGLLKLICADLRKVQQSSAMLDAHEQQGLKLYLHAFVTDFFAHVIHSMEKLFSETPQAARRVAEALEQDIRNLQVNETKED